jgi:hypothetical protein
MLPRIPVPIQREFKVKLMQEEMNHARGRANEGSVHQLVPGAHIRALYGDEENPLAWYDAIVDEIVPPVNEWDKPKYTVTFPECVRAKRARRRYHSAAEAGSLSERNKGVPFCGGSALLCSRVVGGRPPDPPPAAGEVAQRALGCTRAQLHKGAEN